MDNRVLGKSGIQVSPMGLGCWAIGGDFWFNGVYAGWKNTEDEESIRAVKRALELGVNFFDTADCYGAGHSERILAEALKGNREKAVIATKFGNVFDEQTKKTSGYDVTPAYIRKACEASLRRLHTDYIDVYQLHVWELPLDQVPMVVDTLDKLKEDGLIRTYGWSTDRLDGLQLFAKGTYCSVVQNVLNVLEDAGEIIDLCEQQNLASINRSCLMMGILSGKFNKESQLSKDDVRGAGQEWLTYFKDGKPDPEFLVKLDAVKEILQSGGRSLVQGALAWIWGRSEKTIPIPGFRTVKQVEENAGAIDFGPLNKNQMDEIEAILNR